MIDNCLPCHADHDEARPNIIGFAWSISSVPKPAAIFRGLLPKMQFSKLFQTNALRIGSIRMKLFPSYVIKFLHLGRKKNGRNGRMPQGSISLV